MNLERETSPNPSLDELLEKRLAILRDSIELKLTKEVDVILKNRFETTGKILGWAFGAVALIFTALGIKTLSDIRDIARDTAVDEVKKKLAIDDPNSEFRRDIDKIVARGLIDSYLLTLAKNKQEEFPSDLEISEGDLQRLIDLIQDQRTSPKDFGDACEILLSSGQVGTRQRLSNLFRDLGSIKDKKYNWLIEQPEKRAVLFRLYLGGDLKESARGLVSSDRTDDGLLIAAMKYLSRVSDKGSVQAIERLTKNPDEDIAWAATLELARLEPKSPILTAWPKTLTSSSTDEDWVKALRLAAVMARHSDRLLLREDPDAAVRRNIPRQLMSGALDAGFIFRLADFGRSSGIRLYAYSRMRPSQFYNMPSDLLAGYGGFVVQDLLRQAGPDAALFKARIRSLCLDYDDQCAGVVRVNLEEGGIVMLASGVQLDKKSAPFTLTLKPASPDANADVLVSWSDQAAVSKSGTLSKVLDSNKMKFDVSTNLHIAKDEEDDL